MPIIPVLVLRQGGVAVLLLTLRERYYACSYCREVMPALRCQLMTHTCRIRMGVRLCRIFIE